MQRRYRFEDIPVFDHHTDVLVAGLGGAGACATLEARAAGAEVMVLEWSAGGGGSTMMSACEMYLGGSGGTALQRDLGFEDSTENFLNYLKTAFGPYADPARMTAYAEGAAEHFDWMEAQGVPYKRGFYPHREVVAETGDSLQYTGNEKAWPFNDASEPVPRGHLPADSGHSGGVTLMTQLLSNVAASGADVRCDARATGLIQDDSGRIRGVVARIDNRNVTIEARRGVVLCQGGFIMNEQMSAQHIPYLNSICTRHGNPNDRGDGILMGTAVGGHAINMGEAFLCVANYPPRQLTYGIFVNDKGQRFINEDVYIARLGHYAAVQQSNKVYMFIDNENFARPAYAQAAEVVAVGETVEEVERDSPLPEGSLVATVNYYNAMAAKGEDPLFHKSADWLQPFGQPPYALMLFDLEALKPPVFTLGGLDTLPSGEVLNSDREPIPGLFAAGRTAAGIPRNAQGYASGMSVGDATFFGRRAGCSAAAAADNH